MTRLFLLMVTAMDLSPLINRVHHVDALRLLRALPDNCENLVVISDPPFGVNYRYYLDDAEDMPYWVDAAKNAHEYAAWFAPFYREIVRVTPLNGLLALYQAINYREHFARWYGEHSQLVSLRFRQNYFADLVVVQRKTPQGMRAVKLHSNFMVNTYKTIDAQVWLRCAKTVAEMTELIKSYTSPNAIILDPFAGIGTTGLAAMQAKRHFILAELHREPFLCAKQRLAANLM